MANMFRRFGSRIAAALALAKPGEIKTIGDQLDAAIKGHTLTHISMDESGRSDAVPPAISAPYGREQRSRQRSVRKGTQSRFHAKHGGSAMHAAINHRNVNNRALQFINGTLLQRLLWRSGAMDATHPKALTWHGTVTGRLTSAGPNEQYIKPEVVA